MRKFPHPQSSLSVDSKPTFAAAAKHLFRHLHDAQSLRKNPIVRRFFAETTIEELGGARERTVLKLIHSIVREAAERYRNEGCRSGKDQTTLLEYKILTMQCLERIPIREVAASLGISYYYCYRRRANICRRIAQYVLDYDDDPALDFFAEFDEFQVLLDTARHGSVLGDVQPALQSCIRLMSLGQTIEQRIEVLRMRACILLRQGNLREALEPRREASALLLEYGVTSSLERDSSRARLALLECRIARFRANKLEACSFARTAVELLEPVYARATISIKELYVESLFELTATLCNLGEFEEAYEWAVQAEANLRNIRRTSAWLRARVMVMLWRLRSNMLLSSKAWYPAPQRARGLTSALEDAYSAGALAEGTEALIGLADHYAWAGKDVEALNAAESARLLSRQQSKRARLHTAIRVGLSLSITQFRQKALSSLPNPAQLDCCDEFHRATLSYLNAEEAFLNGQFDSAWTLANRASDQSEYTTLTISRWLVAAASAHELGRRRDARGLIEMAIPAAEHSAVAPVLRDAYRVGARITSDPRLRRQANEVTNLLAR